MPYYTPEHYKDPTAGAVLMDKSKWKVTTFDVKETPADRKRKAIKEENIRKENEMKRRGKVKHLRNLLTELDSRRAGLEKRKVSYIKDIIIYMRKREVDMKMDFSKCIAELEQAEDDYKTALTRCQSALRIAERQAANILEGMTGVIGH